MGRTWSDVESDLQTGWEKYEYRPQGGSTWEKVKDAVSDAWHRVTGQKRLDVDKLSESSERVKSSRKL